MQERAPLIPEQRRQLLLELLREDGIVSTRRVLDHLGVSRMTVRRDVARLEDEGLVLAVPGGVRLRDATPPPARRSARMLLGIAAKRAIARAAAAEIPKGAVVYLDAGTTCQAVVPLIAERRDLTVVTADLYTAGALLEAGGIRTIHVGGVADADSGSTAGHLAARTVRDIHLDLYLLSAGSWSLARGVTTPSLDKLDLKSAAMGSADRTILMADSSKYGAVTEFRVAELNALAGIITDDALSDGARDE